MWLSTKKNTQLIGNLKKKTNTKEGSRLQVFIWTIAKAAAIRKKLINQIYNTGGETQ